VAAADHSEQDQARSWTRYLPLAALGGAMVIVFATGAHRIFSLETIVAYRDKLQAFVDHYGPMAVIAYAAVYVIAVALSIPGAVFLTILGGFLFGWFFGGAVAAVSATLGAVLVFLIARTSVGDILVRKAGPKLQKFADGFREVCIPKAAEHREADAHARHEATVWTDDLVAAEYCARNPEYVGAFVRFAARAAAVVFEHPYLAPMLDLLPPGARVVYSSLNVERDLKAETLRPRRDATAEIARVVALEDFFTGPGRTVLQSDEVLVEFRIPASAPSTGKAYLKHGRRKAMELATVGVAVTLSLDAGRVSHARIVLGAVAPTPIRARRAEALLLGEKPVDALLAAAAQAALEESRPITDVRASADYRRQMVGVLTQRALVEALKEVR